MLEDYFNKHELSILYLLYKARRELTTSQIAEKLGISWGRAMGYLNQLCEETYILKRKQGNRTYWIYFEHYHTLPYKEKEKWLDCIENTKSKSPKRLVQLTFDEIL
jgi:DNA-binding transcriptional regulator GbsR (MarR family)